MRSVLAALLLTALLALSPIALSSGTLYDGREDVNTGRPFRKLITTEVTVPSDIFVDLDCFDNVVAEVIVQTVAPGGGVAACTSGTLGGTVVQAEPGPVTILILGEGTSILAPGGAFRVQVYAQDRN